jgi:hypothetical protein
MIAWCALALVLVHFAHHLGAIEKERRLGRRVVTAEHSAMRRVDRFLKNIPVLNEKADVDLIPFWGARDSDKQGVIHASWGFHRSLNLG